MFIFDNVAILCGAAYGVIVIIMMLILTEQKYNKFLDYFNLISRKHHDLIRMDLEKLRKDIIADGSDVEITIDDSKVSAKIAKVK